MLKERCCTVLVLIIATVAWSVKAVAQDAGTAPATESTPQADSDVEHPTAPVVIDGVTLFEVRGISAYPAERRAGEIEHRIAALAGNRSLLVESLVVRDGPLATVLVADGHPVLSVLNADGQEEGVSRQVLAEVYRQRVVEAIRRFRADRQASVLWKGFGKAAAATVGLALFLLLGFRVARLVHHWLERRYRSRLHDIRFRTVEIVRGEHLWQGARRAMRAAAVALALLTGYLYLDYVLLLFPWTRALGHNLLGLVLRPLAAVGGAIIRYIPNVIFLVLLAWVTRYVLKLVAVLFQRVTDGRVTLPGFEAEWARPTDRIVRVLVITFAVMIAYPYIPGSESDAFKGVSLLLGVMFSLGSSSVIGNMIAGQSLAFRRAFKIGDRIKVGEHMGVVTQTRLLTTFLRSPKNEQVVIPNSIILNTEVVNFTTLSKDAGLILHTVVGIRYEVSWRKVENLLLEAAARTPGLLRQPAPFVLQKALGTFAVDHEINVYCDNPLVAHVLYAALHQNILDVFNEHAIQIMTPAYEGDPETAKVVPREDWPDQGEASNGAVAAGKQQQLGSVK